jgi:hypothetical protein
MNLSQPFWNFHICCNFRAKFVTTKSETNVCTTYSIMRTGLCGTKCLRFCDIFSRQISYPSCKLKIPLRIKVFNWYLHRGVILTKDDLSKHNWHGSTKCVFCHQHETIKHLFFQCHFARSIWSVIQVALTLYPSQSNTNILRIGSMVSIKV